MSFERMHGGTDAQGIPAHDFSTNRNACGPCPSVVAQVQQASTLQYPDPSYAALRAELAAFHAVDPARIVIAGSGSEWIQRLTLHAVRHGVAGVSLPQWHYGDYPQAAALWKLPLLERVAHAAGEGLHWACEPSSPVGRAEEVWPWWQHMPPHGAWRVLDCAYRPLMQGDCAHRLGTQEVHEAFHEAHNEDHRHALEHVWQMWTPNKALGMTGIRAAYVIAPVHAPEAELHALRELAPSWVIGAHGVAMLAAWTQPATQDWLRQSLVQLQDWKRQQIEVCHELGWTVLDGHLANYFVARWPQRLQGAAMAARLAALRAQGIKLRDAASFGLAGHVRLGVLPPASQQALRHAWQQMEGV